MGSTKGWKRGKQQRPAALPSTPGPRSRASLAGSQLLSPLQGLGEHRDAEEGQKVRGKASLSCAEAPSAQLGNPAHQHGT